MPRPQTTAVDAVNQIVAQETAIAQAMGIQNPERFTHRQIMFIYNYVTNKGNGGKAAIDAGHSPHSAYEIAYENLRKPQIKAEIDRIFNEQIMRKEEVIKRISDIARGSINDYIRVVQDKRRTRVNVPLTAVIERIRAQIEDEGKFMVRKFGTLTDKQQAQYDERVEAWLDQILRYEIELERNPLSEVEEDGPYEVFERVELDLVAIARDKERGIIKKFSQEKNGEITIEFYDVDGALRDLGRVHGIFEKDNAQQPPTQFNMANFTSQELNILLAMQQKASTQDTNG